MGRSTTAQEGAPYATDTTAGGVARGDVARVAARSVGDERGYGVRVPCECQRTDAADLLSPQKHPAIRLTAAELSVLKAFSYCDTNKEIAAQLGMSAATVKSHADDLFHKLRVHSRSHALGRALRLGLITLRDLTPPLKGGEKSTQKGYDGGKSFRVHARLVLGSQEEG